MSLFIDDWAAPLVWGLIGWSLRWGALIVALMTASAIRPRMGAAARLLAAQLVLFAGLLLPLMPVFWGPIARHHEPAEVQLPPQPAPIPAPPRQSYIPVERSWAIDEPAAHTAEPLALPVASKPSHFDLPLSTPQVHQDRLRTGQVAMAIAGGLWLAGVVLMTARLMHGTLWLRRLREKSVAADAVCQSELVQCSDRLNVKRAVRLCLHPAVAAPILAAGWRPCILVPVTWPQYPPATRQAVLLHELAHVRRWDDLAKLLEELIRVAFFFHPLVLWLLARIGADREETCDAAVINAGVAPRQLAAVLLECCRHCGPGRPSLALGIVALPFFTQRSVKDRIQSLMEEQDMSRWTTKLSRRAVAGVLSLVVGAVAVAAGFGVRAEVPPPKTADSEVPPKPSADKTPWLIDIDDNSAIPLTIDLTNLLAGQDVASLSPSNLLPVEGFGKFNMHELALSAMPVGPEMPRARLVDIHGNPLQAQGKLPATARVMAFETEGGSSPFGFSVLADAEGRFASMIPRSMYGDADEAGVDPAEAAALAGDVGSPPPVPGAPPPLKDVPALVALAAREKSGTDSPPLVTIWVQLAGGAMCETRYAFSKEQVVDVRLPTHFHPRIAPPEKLAAGEIAGVVVDESGEPLEGVAVEVAASECCQSGQKFAVSNRLGRFALHGLEVTGDLDEACPRPVRFTKAGYAPTTFLYKPQADRGWVVALDKRTYLEGTVRRGDGRPAEGVVVRGIPVGALGAPMMFNKMWAAEAFTDAAGRYRLYVEPGSYEVSVRVPGVGIARFLTHSVQPSEQRAHDIALQPGVTFRARIVDAETQKAVPGVRLWNPSYSGIEGHSDVNGTITIADVFSGEMIFNVEADAHARWWSPQSRTKENRQSQIDNQYGPGNLRPLDFNIRPDMAATTIVVERSAVVRGRVVDPEGNPAGGATVSPKMAGATYSLGNGLRYSVETLPDGTFEMRLPASHRTQYHLVAHDGGVREFRRWANGVGPLFMTIPGQQVDGMELKLTRPGTIRGRVIDTNGKPVADYTVNAKEVSQMENGFYARLEVKTDLNGKFELSYLRPGEYMLEVESPTHEFHNQPWFGEEPVGRWKKPLALAEGETVVDVEIKVEPEKLWQTGFRVEP